MIILVKFIIGVINALFISYGIRRVKNVRRDLIDYSWCIIPPSVYLFLHLILNMNPIIFGALFTFGAAYLFSKISLGTILKKKVRNFVKSFLEEDKDE